MKFKITKEEKRKVKDWLNEEVYPEIVQRQENAVWGKKTDQQQVCWAKGRPYEGAISGVLEYWFHHTGIGLAYGVRYLFGEYRYELNLTDYSTW